MKTTRYTKDTNYYAEGFDTANTLAYMLEGFRDGWQCFGLVKMNTKNESFGCLVEGMEMCAVYGIRFSDKLEADDHREQEQIDAGKTAVVLFYGTDNEFYMRRMTPEEYDNLVLYEYKRQRNDLFYNS